MKKIAIIGAGSWGTALAIVLSSGRSAHRIALWAHEPEIAERMCRERTNAVFLPGFEIPAEIEITAKLGDALRDAAIILGVMPSAFARRLYAEMLPHLSSQPAIVSATKGLEPDSLLRISQVIAEVTSAIAPRIAVLTGPSFAREVARGDPTAVLIASCDTQLAAEIQREFSGPTLRLYAHDDVIGAELGGALKNVIAIAAGVSEGLGYGHNSNAALITRGLAEVTRLACALGARPETLAGLAGMGDLVLTCTGELSRNRSVGVQLGKGRKLAEILTETKMVAEGVGTTAATYALAQRLKMEAPITEQMYQVLYQGKSPRQSIRELMERPLKRE